MKSLLAFGFVGLILAACGGSTNSSGSSVVNGTVGGAHVATTSSIGLTGTRAEPAGTTTIQVAYAGVLITSLANTCSAIENNSNPANASSLSLIVASPGTAIAPGTYAIGTTSTATVDGSFITTTATCADGINQQIASGSITLSAVSSASVKGTFDVTMAGGDHVTGSFDAPVCNVDLASVGTGTTKPCGS